MTEAEVPCWAKKARLKFDRHENKWMILYPERGLSLNDEGGAIAQKIDGSRTVKAIVDELAKEFGAPRDVLAKDVDTFLEDLKKKRLIEVRAVQS